MSVAAKELRPRRGDLSPHASLSHRVAVVRLALDAGDPGSLRGLEWSVVLDHAVRERCGYLAWMRSAPRIRAGAPALVSERWRAHALAAGERAAAQVEELHALIAALSSARLAPVVLKGQPLAVMLYGDVAARPVFDTDVFIRRSERPAAHEVLLANGWRHLDGEPPAEGTYKRIARARNPHLEVHSSLLDDALLAHLGLAEPGRSPLLVAGHAVQAHVGETLPVFLAVHLAKHAGVPLLWWIDFATLWHGLRPAERDAARTVAAEYRLRRFLEWAEHGVGLLETAAHGPESDACRALADLDGMHRRRNAARVATLTESMTDRAAVALGWLFPPRERHSPRSLALGVLRRLRNRIRRTSMQTPSGAPDPEPSSFARTVELGASDVASLVRQVVSAGGAAWIRVRGTSMLPTIPRIAEVLISPIPPEGVSVGDVVLVDRAASGLLMHRVVNVRGDVIHLRGDNRLEPDRPVDVATLLGVATKLRTNGRLVTLERRPRKSLRFAAARLRKCVWRRFAGA